MVAANHSALQQARDATALTGRPTPRPFPLFLDMVRRAAETEPDLARKALAGVTVYGNAARTPPRDRPVVARQGRVSLRDCSNGAGGVPVILVPSLINAADILDLAPGNSVCDHLANSGFRPLLVDWGVPEPTHRDEGLATHVQDYLVPLLGTIDRPFHLLGYCLGGSMALAASTKLPLRSLTLVATPWHFDRYPAPAREAAAKLWREGADSVDAMGLMPLEMMQTLFWAIDEARTVRKYALLADRADDLAYVDNFVRVEDWTNSGAPLTAAVARDILDRLMQRGDVRTVAGNRTARPPAHAHHFTATNDAIAPEATAPDHIAKTACRSGHVGMVVGRSAPQGLWRQITDWLSAQP